MALDGHQSGQSLRIRIARILGEPQARVSGRAAQPVSLPLAVLALLIALISAPQFLAGLRPATNAVKAMPRALYAAHAASQTASHLSALARTVAVPVRQAATLAIQDSAQDSAAQDKPAEERPAARTGGTSYIDQMRAAGYDVDLDKLIAMKVQGVTPDYARAMSEAGFGKLSADDLVACKIQGVTPEYLTELKEKGLTVKSVHEAISFRIFGVTPEFVAGMKAAGFDGLSSEELTKLRVQGVTPEYARQIAQQFPGASVDDVVKTRIFGIDGDFIARAKKFGFNSLSIDKLVKLRISGVLDDEPVKP